MNFDGYDFSELSRAFGIDSDEAQPLMDYLSGLDWLDEKVFSETAAVCRKFLEALAVDSEKHTYSAPFWRGLLAVEHDQTFMQHFIPNIPFMWT